ncbi:hypothetical protein ARAM_000364 [Aspergillus rambellii]|uniref:Xylanolytic transcriptional activator regulatory domain-containing protein n=1 Tax=Aspergillus rambellii TaxID=308745 RepID=A0A0F8XTC2_9EURO|nr:hypothetical protein ARAM_000364 [Aspergillus rambellii]
MSRFALAVEKETRHACVRMDSITRGQVGEVSLPGSLAARPKDPRSLFASPSTGSGVQGAVGPPPAGKVEILRQRLAAMLPCQADVDCLLASSHGWWLLQQHIMPHLPDLTENDVHGLFNLPPGTDLGKLQTTVLLREMMRGIHDFLLKNVTSDDELAGNVESVECLALQGMYEVNAGNLRRSWLSFRRAITIAQLLGLHRGAVNSSEDLVETKRHHLWYQISRGERYLSTLLGLPSSTGSAGFPFDAAAAAAAWLSPEDLYHKNLYHISGLILARNQEPCTHSFSTTQRIGEQLDALAAQMPAAWWEIPRTILNTRTKEASAQFERIMCQIWHFELATLAHLPFMLRAATDRRYEYSHISCLDASRNLIKRWIAIHQSPRTTLVFSNLLEFQTFTAATTLVLGLLAPQRRSTDPDVLQARLDDSQLVETVLESFERLPRQGRGGGDDRERSERVGHPHASTVSPPRNRI